ncbi:MULTISPECIES: hypothetical protein [Serratia]|uniref:hypothetical protein n=1 Tax=Serratia TaxID=613 RepID=UPI0007455AD5|nr:hypothetical protein [Serratia marcescens]CAE7760468.1 hypothetical protein AI2795V1_1794 [Serratia marcescens]CAH3638465.1 hypothetical protein AI2795V1_1794 [Serratia marcescens]CUY84875.1 Uncharacterised protein [Serratia marcescens]CVD08879.1 Uncharacterised protein [Serratia marcescens]BEL65267.1 hypothetical protein SM10VA1_11550 [Serratia marcescens]
MPGKITSAVVILLALAAVFGAGAWLAARHYQPTIDRLNESLTQCRDTGRQQESTIASQNAGIDALQRKRDELEAKAKAVQAKARREAQGDYERANEVMAERTTGDLCGTASAAFDAELRRERAQ